MHAITIRPQPISSATRTISPGRTATEPGLDWELQVRPIDSIACRLQGISQSAHQTGVAISVGAYSGSA